ncbi:4-phosphopantetheinyl transferase [Bacillus thuringiensis]|nr:4-phosphopantetheinyl transferase [Bacillus thuringiensis]
MRDILPGTVLHKLNFKGEKQEFLTTFCLSRFHTDRHFIEAREFLNNEEKNYYYSLRHERRIQSYLLGRYVAKVAGSFLANDSNLSNVMIERGVFTQPVVNHPQIRMNISISHCNQIGVAVACSEGFVMGLDIELITSSINSVLKSHLTNGEKNLLQKWSYRLDALPTLLWTCKESLSKALRTGLTSPFQIFEVDSLKVCGSSMILAEYKNFPQYRTISVLVDPYVLSFTYPKITEPPFEQIEEMMLDMKTTIQNKEPMT